MRGGEIIIEIRDEAETRRLACDLAMALVLAGSLKTGCMVHLSGDLGSGKSVLARTMIRHLSGDPALEVPSPTFSLVQHYALPDPSLSGGASPLEILHGDLYRIGDPRECLELGLTQTIPGRLCLVEWPENGEGELAEADLAIHLAERGDAGSETRRATLSGTSAIMAAVGRSLAIRSFLDDGWGPDVERRPLQGDASSRAYELARLNGKTRILMNAPRQVEGPPVRDGKSYNRIARRAEDVTAFAGVAAILRRAGLTVPQIHAADIGQGLLLIEHLGTGQITDAERRPIGERYLATVEAIAGFHAGPVETRARLDTGAIHTVPPYDRDAMMIEVELLADWYAPRFKGATLTTGERAEFTSIWDALIATALAGETRLCLRDLHSPNIIWRPERTGTARVGLIDFQDAVIGPAAYDIACLGQDARVDVDAALEQAITDRYCDLRRQTGPFDRAAFERDYAIMAAQRVTKILGIFVRLDEQDGKPAYLEHMPRLHGYLERSFAHPVLKAYRDWYRRVIGTAGA